MLEFDKKMNREIEFGSYRFASLAGLFRSHDSTTAANAVNMIASVTQYKTGLLVFNCFVAILIAC